MNGRGWLASRALVLVCLALGLAACTHSSRTETIHTGVVTVSALRDGFIAWDADHQAQIISDATSKDEGAAKLAAYRTARTKVLDTFEAVRELLAIALAQNDDPSLTAALGQLKALAVALNKLRGGL